MDEVKPYIKTIEKSNKINAVKSLDLCALYNDIFFIEQTVKKEMKKKTTKKLHRRFSFCHVSLWVPRLSLKVLHHHVVSWLQGVELVCRRLRERHQELFSANFFCINRESFFVPSFCHRRRKHDS